MTNQERLVLHALAERHVIAVERIANALEALAGPVSCAQPLRSRDRYHDATRDITGLEVRGG